MIIEWEKNLQTQENDYLLSVPLMEILQIFT